MGFRTMMMSRSDSGKSSATFAMKRNASDESLAPIGRTSGKSDCLIVINHLDGRRRRELALAAPAAASQRRPETSV